jgi:hypothetical protein
MNTRILRFIWAALVVFCAGCANITAPTGGKKDTIPPKLLSVDPPDSLLNTRVSKIVLTFNKYITVTDASKEVELSPILSIPPGVKGLYKKVTIKIADTLLEDNTTYRLTFGNAIKDIHEGNIFAKYVYTFSTGPYFDSLTLHGTVINAATGLADTGGIYVVLYSAKDNDSAVVRHKPKYVVKADAKGKFEFKGLPKRSFRIYALKDPNGNLIYDGPGEMIAYNEFPVTPGDTLQSPIRLRMFAEIIDTSAKKKTDTSARLPAFKKAKQGNVKNTYSSNLDTTNINKRSFDLNSAIKITFTKMPVFNRAKIRLSYDTAGADVPVPVALYMDSLHTTELHIVMQEDSLYPKHLHSDNLSWKENTVYTLRLSKGFAKDTSGEEFLPARFVFRTLDDDNYGKITVHLPSKYYSDIPSAPPTRRNDTIPDYVLVVSTEKDTIYQQKVTDTLVTLARLIPGKYSFRIIVDKNKNGKWDTGDLFGKT